MAVRLFKLVTGEEIIGRCEPSAGGTLMNAKDVRTVTRLPIQSPQGVTFINVLANYFGGSATDNLALKPEHIVAECDPDADLERVYMKTVSGIELATAMPPKGRG